MKKLVDIYRAKNKEGAYVYLEQGKATSSLPEPLLAQTGKLEKAMTLVLTPDRKLAQADASKVIESIEEQGFYLQMPPRPEAYMQEIPNDKLPQTPL